MKNVTKQEIIDDAKSSIERAEFHIRLFKCMIAYLESEIKLYEKDIAGDKQVLSGRLKFIGGIGKN